MYKIYAQTPLEIVSIKDASHTAVLSGDWSELETWGGELPRDGSKVYIPSNIEITISGRLSARLKSIRLEGKLSFSNDKNTKLQVETLVSAMSGSLEIGTADDPIAIGITAEILFIDEGPLEHNSEFSKGAVLMGPVRVYGAQKSGWEALTEQPTAGASSITTSNAPVGWEVGDEIVITGTEANDPESDEKRMIEAIDGPVITLSRVLERDHTGPEDDLEVHVANLSRNVIFSSENAEIRRRAHMMFMHNLDVEVYYAQYYQMGRTNKSVQEDDFFFPGLDSYDAEPGARTNIRGRYSCHFHRGGVNPATDSPAHVEGCVVEDDPGWAYVSHSSYVDFVDNVSYNIVGGAFQTEAGDEIGSFIHNMAIRTVNPDFPLLSDEFFPVDIREDSQDFAFQGDGFWFHGGGVSVEDNVASGSSGHGFIYWAEGLREANLGGELANLNQMHFRVSNIPNGELLPDLDFIDMWWHPVSSFKGNQSYSSTNGFAAYYIHASLFEDITELTAAYLATVHSTFENLTIWNVRNLGIELQNCERFTFKNLKMINEGNAEAIGIKSWITVATRSIWDNAIVKGFGQGMIVPMAGNITISNGIWSNLHDFILLPPQRDSRAYVDDRDVRFDGVEFVASPYFPTNHIINFKMEGKKTLEGDLFIAEPEYAHRYFLIPDRIVVNNSQFNEQRLYYDEQAPDYIPITEQNIDAAEGRYKFDILQKTNQQLFDGFGMSFAGAILPEDAINAEGVSGGKVSSIGLKTNMNFPDCGFINEHQAEADFYDGFNFYDCWESSKKVGGVTGYFDHEIGVRVDVNEKPVEMLGLSQSEFQFSIYPNPASDLIYIRGEKKDAFSLEINNMLGQTEMIIDRLAPDMPLDISQLTSGLYLIRIKALNSNRTTTFKLVKS